MKGRYIRRLDGVYIWARGPIYMYIKSGHHTALTARDLTTGTVQRKRATLTFWCRVGAWPVLLSLINVHLNLQHFLQRGIPCVPVQYDCFSTLAVGNLWLSSLLFKREVSFSGPMQGLFNDLGFMVQRKAWRSRCVTRMLRRRKDMVHSHLIP